MLKFLRKLINLTRSYKRKQKGMFFSEHSAPAVETVVKQLFFCQTYRSCWCSNRSTKVKSC